MDLLGRNFRDETLPKLTSPVQAPALRVLDIPEDEDLLNVGLWEEKATKQWCKFDIVAPDEFNSLLQWKPEQAKNCLYGTGCFNIMGEHRFYTHGGAAKLFYTAHHAVDPAETRRYVSKIRSLHAKNEWPSAIVFDRKFWPTAKSLRAKHPELECLF
eukprot:TRINITY_DN87207_c0_g1_i1.p1 TRINITY_DN87207_c0_g1~~TRINITY_DN87207_c0_g1_i1.p1  ORF type:complete len:157 (-),score=22.16 TRINITY_DN87207_c0_g1_i1:67-537(-)